MLRLLALMALLIALVACAPRTGLDPEYQARYAQTPRTNLACVGESNRAGPFLEFGANACTLLVFPTEARDAVRAEYTVQIYYRTPVGNLLQPRYENRTKEIKGVAPLGPEQPANASFPVYVPDRDFIRRAGRIIGDAFGVVFSLAPIAIGTYFGIPLPPIGLDRTSKALWDEVNSAINDMVNNRDEPYAVQVTARVCGPRLCSPTQSNTVRMP